MLKNSPILIKLFSLQRVSLIKCLSPTKWWDTNLDPWLVSVKNEGITPPLSHDLTIASLGSHYWSHLLLLHLELPSLDASSKREVNEFISILPNKWLVVSFMTTSWAHRTKTLEQLKSFASKRFTITSVHVHCQPSLREAKNWEPRSQRYLHADDAFRCVDPTNSTMNIHYAL
jgi:hypothetical protein